ncbi:hypothetical protein [Flavobacterium sp.]|jgi:hypothetical protein|uniref:hypothetical protein n=1 Tax=Flavobacterium sp. TaxID=239 RepID=UPI002A801283|nr:hypothetical protein [Flavobacterium sp.]
MKKRTIIIGILGIFFLISCGPKRYGCGPGRRCEVKQNSIKIPLEKQSLNKEAQNS